MNRPRKGRFFVYKIMNRKDFPVFDRNEIFAAVDESNKRFDSYTKEQRLELRQYANKMRENSIKIWNIIPKSD